LLYLSRFFSGSEKEGGFMTRAYLLAILSGVALAPSAVAQAPVRFHWQPGDVLTYRVEQVTLASDVVEGQRSETKSKNTNVKRWQVLGVDAAGVATLQLSLAALRFEVTTPKAETLLFDSANPEKSDAQMREQMGKYLGRPLAVLRVDSRGRVVEVKESKFFPASRYESEVPFVITLPEGILQVGQGWERSYQVTLEPPEGTGNRFQAAQKYTCQKLDSQSAIIALATTIKNLPESQLDQVPLFQMQPEGQVIFDVQAGRLLSATLKIDRELKDQQGQGSSYRFESTYTEQYVPAN
jgi:hypothetical protein